MFPGAMITGTSHDKSVGTGIGPADVKKKGLKRCTGN
jgi:hypothetical protein